MKALRKKEGKAPWRKTAIYRRRFKRFRAFQAAFMATSAAAGQARIAAMRSSFVGPAYTAMALIESQQAIVKAVKYAEKWRP